MASLTYLDTHALAWLYAGEGSRFPSAAMKAIEEQDVLVSPVAVVELQYLIEIGRFKAPVDEVLGQLALDIGLQVCELPFMRVARHALAQDWTRDPFDRLIVSQAAVRDSTLVTKDSQIHQNYSGDVWSELR